MKKRVKFSQNNYGFYCSLNYLIWAHNLTEEKWSRFTELEPIIFHNRLDHEL
jgi:hypothetical protein